MPSTNKVIPVAIISWAHIHKAVHLLVARWAGCPCTIKYVYGVPHGGIPVVALVAGVTGWEITEDPAQADLIVDDLVDSGATATRVIKESAKLGNKMPFFDALFRKPTSPKSYALDAVEVDGWLEFPWERANSEGPAQDAVTRILQAIGEDAVRDGLLETPARVVKSWGELYAGYSMNPEDIVKVFDVPEANDDIVLLKDVELHSMCEHHMLPFHGRCHIAYIPKDKAHVLGVSKLARLMECYARRLQVQERIGRQVTDFLMGEHVQAQAAACIIEAKHMCVSSRGVGKQHSVMVTSSMQGIFRDMPPARAELMQMIKG